MSVTDTRLISVFVLIKAFSMLLEGVGKGITLRHTLDNVCSCYVCGSEEEENIPSNSISCCLVPGYQGNLEHREWLGSGKGYCEERLAG